MSIVKGAANVAGAAVGVAFFAVGYAVMAVVGGVQYMYAKANDALVSQSIKSEKEDIYKKTKANLTEIFVRNSLPLAKENDEISEYLKCSVDAISEAKANQTVSSKYVEEKNGWKIGAANALWDVTYLHLNAGVIEEGGVVFRDAAIKGVEKCYDALLVGKSVLPRNSEKFMLATKSFIASYDGIDRNIALDKNNTVSLVALKKAVELAYAPLSDNFKKDVVTGDWRHSDGRKVSTDFNEDDIRKAVALPLSENELACLNERLSQAAMDTEDSFSRNSGPYLMSASDWKIKDTILEEAKKRGVASVRYVVAGENEEKAGKVFYFIDWDVEMRKRSSEAQKNNMTALTDVLSEKFQNALSSRGIATCLSTRGAVQRQQIQSDLKWLSPKLDYDFQIRH